MDAEYDPAYSCLDIKDVCENSKECVKDGLFIAHKGEKTDGIYAVKEALDKGCAAVVTEKRINISKANIVCKSTRCAAGRIFSNFCNSPYSGMTLCAVTGTAGKTTVCHILYHIFSKIYGKEKCMLIATGENRTGNKVYPSDMTTPDLKTVYTLMQKAKTEGVEYGFIEASSHALSYRKLDQLNFKLGLINNISRDHLDYHKTMEEYLKAKLHIRDISRNVLVNKDDPALKDLPFKGFSLCKGEYLGKAPAWKNRISFTLSGAEAKIPLYGKFNLYNTLAALSAADMLGIAPCEACPTLESFTPPPGRFDVISIDRQRKIIIDFAHTPKELKEAIIAAREITDGRVITLFGCGGNRDRGKRPVMGKVAAEYSDLVYITSDNSRGESTVDIIEEIISEIKNKTNYKCVPVRKEAVHIALDEASEGDTVLLAGKGHENYEITKGVKIPYSDRETAEEYLMEKTGFITTKQAAKMCNGTFDGEDRIITGYQTDSRRIKEGDLFIAFKGENADGHDFIESALEKGAAAALSEREMPGKNCIVVDNTLDALHRLAKAYIEPIRPKICAVTGSVGKTTTKEFVHAALSCNFKAQKTEGNLNSTIGLPITLLSVSPDSEYLVCEMGMSALGEIEKMSLTAQPDIAVITNIGTSHLEMLGSRENILKAKMEILSGMKEGGCLILNGDDRYLSEAKIPQGIAKITYGTFPENDYTAENIKFGDGAEFDIRKKDGTLIKGVTIPALGMHNVYNATAAYAVAEYAGAGEAEIRKGLMTFVPAGMRQRIYDVDGVTVICDCYNASPESMKASFSVLQAEKEKKGGRAIAVLGQMRELGAMSEALHRATGEALAASGADALFASGEESYAIAEGAETMGMKNVIRLPDMMSDGEKASRLAAFVNKGDTVLFKASRAVMLENICTAFEELIK